MLFISDRVAELSELCDEIHMVAFQTSRFVFLVVRIRSFFFSETFEYVRNVVAGPMPRVRRSETCSGRRFVPGSAGSGGVPMFFFSSIS